VPVNHPDEINEIFDSISYGKGASVIRMIANFLGLETFNGGITNYLNKHEYANAKQVSACCFQYNKTLLGLLTKQPIFLTTFFICFWANSFV
jgi:hypothetical protein